LKYYCAVWVLHEVNLILICWCDAGRCCTDYEIYEEIGTTEWTRTTDPYHVKVVL
jgi:hypothetical protein